jgi:hypothetical protein
LPFLRLTRDRRGTENTYLLHADRPGDRPRLLYWYRTAPGILLGRSPLDEDAIRTIEEQHPDIDFDWPAILALSEVMTPEEEAPAPRPPQQQQQRKRSATARERPRELRRDDRSQESSSPVEPTEALAETLIEPEPIVPAVAESEAELFGAEPEPPPRPTTRGLLEELVGREIATRLRARYSEILARIHEQPAEASVRDAWVRRADKLNPDLWLTPDAILDGVRNADGLFDALRSELVAP